MATLKILGRSGHDTVTFERTDSAAVEQAKKVFDDYVARNYMAFKVDAPEKPGEIIKEFDEQAEEIVLAPPMAGG